MNELKPCPFCAHKATMNGAGDAWSVMCSNNLCEATTSKWSTQEQALAAWNARAKR